MSLEITTYLNGLVSANPPSGDQVSQGDDHIRLIKAVLLNSFPNISGAVTLSHTQINQLQTDMTTVLANYVKKDGTVAFTGVVSGITPTLAAHLATKSYVDAGVAIAKVDSFNTRTGAVTLTSSDVTTALGYTPWHAGNDGAGSGLDADLLDGQSSAYFTDIAARLGFNPAPRPTASLIIGNWGRVMATPPNTTVPGLTGEFWAYFYVAGNSSTAGIAQGATTISTPIGDSPVLFWRVI